MAEQPTPRRKPVAQALKENAPWMPPTWDEADVGALQALQIGKAEPHQQQRALKFIIETICDTYGLGWHPSGPHEASFAAGKRWPGTQIVKFLNLNMKALRRP